jgi:hypothetical protein
MNCTICNHLLPVNGGNLPRGYALALPRIVSRRKTGNLTALSFRGWDYELSLLPNAVVLCGMGCATTALDRYLHSGTIDKPMTEAAVAQIEAEVLDPFAELDKIE